MTDKPALEEQQETAKPNPQDEKRDMEQVQEDAAYERETERGYQ